MASPITIGGVQVLAAGQGDTFLWGSAIQTALAQIAATCLQTTGGSFPLTADLNLGSSFGLIAPYYKSANGANIAASGLLRALNTESAAWRNSGNTGDNLLGIGQGTSQPTDELIYKNATAGITHQLTGNPVALYVSSVAVSWAVALAVVNYPTAVIDTDSAVTTGASWKFTVPTAKGGIYLIYACLGLLGTAVASNAASISIYKNAGPLTSGITNTNGAVNLTAQSAYITSCSPGDTLYAQNASTVAYSGLANSVVNYIFITRLPVGAA